MLRRPRPLEHARRALTIFTKRLAFAFDRFAITLAEIDRRLQVLKISPRRRNGTQISIAPGKATNASAVDLDPHTHARRDQDLMIAVFNRLDRQILGQQPRSDKFAPEG